MPVQIQTLDCLLQRSAAALQLISDDLRSIEEQISDSWARIADSRELLARLERDEQARRSPSV